MLKKLLHSIFPPKQNSDYRLSDPVVRDKCFDVVRSCNKINQFGCCSRYLELALDGGHITMHVWSEANFELQKKVKRYVMHKL